MIAGHRTWDRVVLDLVRGGNRRKRTAIAIVALLAVGTSVGTGVGPASAHDWQISGLNGAQLQVSPDGYPGGGTLTAANAPTVQGRKFIPSDVALVFQCIQGEVNLLAQCQRVGMAPTTATGTFTVSVPVLPLIYTPSYPTGLACAGEGTVQCSVVAATFNPVTLQPTSKAEHYICFESATCAPGPTDPEPTTTSTSTSTSSTSTSTSTSTSSTLVPPPRAKVADFDGDGDTDISVFRPSNGVWYLENGQTSAWGIENDIPVPGDYDADGDADIAVARPTGRWYVKNGAHVGVGANLVPVPGDYDGNRSTDFAGYRPSDGRWEIKYMYDAGWGTAGDIPIPADYDGDGSTERAVFRPSTGGWFFSSMTYASFGVEGDIPVPADYDGNGTADIAVFRPSNGVWYFANGFTAAFGVAGDIPVPGDYDGNGTTDIAVFRPSEGVWYFADGSATAWGTSGDIPAPLAPAIYLAFFNSGP
ncbi:MAG TPA: VCBS repeat-containing protein [Acidimicrobiales bacterium]|nr:VCBS repeat-containing protein [Acidimicrobiales bacterium]